MSAQIARFLPVIFCSMALACGGGGGGDGTGTDAADVDDGTTADSSAGDDTGGVSGECEPGFSGDDCSFCTLASAGSACHPMTPRDTYDLDAIKALTLTDLKWTVLETATVDGVEVVEASWSGGIFQAINADGEEEDIELRERAALYIPPDYATTPNPGLGLVFGVHFADSVKVPIGARIAAEFGIPVLYHGEEPADWKDLGFPGRGHLNSSSTKHIVERNPCEPDDLVRGDFGYALARTHMRAITLLQRLAEEGGGSVDKVALRGFSKEGKAVWRATLVDDRIEVGSPGGWHFQDPETSKVVREEAWGCAGADGTTSDEAAAYNDWLNNTPAGAAWFHYTTVGIHKDLLTPRLYVIDGDVAGPDMHDGNNYPTGAETPFLDAFVEAPWRYVRKANVIEGATDDDGDVTSKTALPVLAAELLVAGPGAEETLYPKVLDATAEVSGTVLSATAEATAPAEAAALFWTWSDDRRWNEPTQEPWTSVEMTEGSDGEWSSGDVTVPDDKVIAWYVEVRNVLTLQTNGAEYARRDGSPIRFLRETAALSCEVEPAVWCE